MIWRVLVSQQPFRKLPPSSSPFSNFYRRIASAISLNNSISRLLHQHNTHGCYINHILHLPSRISSHRYADSTQQRGLSSSSLSPILDSEDEEDNTMNDFLSRFVWLMRGKITEVYPDSDKETVDGMLLIIVDKVVGEVEKGGLERMLDEAAITRSQGFSEDLWKTVWEVSNKVLEDMNKEKRKEKMKHFLQCQQVKEMVRFAGEVGIRGDLLRELRFKWAKEEMEQKEFYESLERLKKEAEKEEEEEQQQKAIAEVTTESLVAEEKPNVSTLPKRHGKMRYKIYGLDLSDPTWAEVADKLDDAEQITWPTEPKPISGKSKLVTVKILSLNEADDPSLLLGEWKQLLQPTRIDWITLLDIVKEKNAGLYVKMLEIALDEETFQASLRDYSRLIDAHAKGKRLHDAERILNKMNEKGIQPDILITSILAHLYSEAGDVECANKAFESLKRQGFKPHINLYKSMIMVYVNRGLPTKGEYLLREMETRDIKPTEEIYMALLRAFCQHGDISGAVRISNTMQFAGLKPNLEWCTLLVEASQMAGNHDEARSNFDYLMKIGLKPDDRCIASMIAAYEDKNLLDKALNLLLELEKNGFELGIATYSVLVDWFGKLQLYDEVEQLLGKISQMGEAPPFKVHVSLCDMYARAGNEKKALQALGVLEAKKEQMGQRQFERIINGLVAGGFIQDARRMHGLMEAQGLTASEATKFQLEASHRLPQQFGRSGPVTR